jgi:hypothetical protein
MNNAPALAVPIAILASPMIRASKRVAETEGGVARCGWHAPGPLSGQPPRLNEREPLLETQERLLETMMGCRCGRNSG